MEADAIIRSYKETVELMTGRNMADDMKSIINRGEALTNPQDIGSSLEPVTPLSPGRITVKRSRGFARATVARFGEGELYSSIIAQRGSGGVLVSAFDDPEKVEIQQEGAGAQNGYGPTPARPFIGVSDRALTAMTRTANEQGEKLSAELNGITFNFDLNFAM